MNWVDQHPYEVYVDGLLHARFSNPRCAARTIMLFNCSSKPCYPWRCVPMLTDVDKAGRWVRCGELRMDFNECSAMIAGVVPAMKETIPT